ncbi:MAG: RidA family protein [Gammaproteobacteria bacterium]
MKQPIQTTKAPAAIGPYSQAIKSGNTVYFSGQIPLDPETKELVKGDIHVQVTRVFENLKAVVEAAGGDLDSIVRLNVYLTDLADFAAVNEAMSRYFKAPYPARTTLGVSALPKGAAVEVDAIMCLDR